MDRQSDGMATASTPLTMRALRRAVESKYNFKICSRTIFVMNMKIHVHMKKYVPPILITYNVSATVPMKERHSQKTMPIILPIKPASI